jgi:hypothetical protein
MKKFSFLAVSALVLSTCFVSCDKEDEKKDAPVVSAEKKVFILNEGTWEKNNSTLDIYYPDGGMSYQSNVYEALNGQKIGDTAQDLLYYGGRIYMSVFESDYIAKLDLDGRLIEKYSFTPEEGKPRYLAAKDGFVYVSTYSGRIAKFDTASIAAPKGFAEAGAHPEQICIKDNFLYAAVAGDYNVKYENKIAVIDLSTFTFKENIEILEDPTNIITVKDKLYVIHYNTTTWEQEILEVNPADKKYSVYCSGSKIATDGENIYVVNAVTDWSTNATVTTFIKNKSAENFLDLSSVSEISSSIVYLFEIDPDTKDFYVGITDSKTPGTVYRFDKTGKFLDKFTTSWLNPSRAVFVK